MMRLGLYGGSFDPIHYGHVRPVLKAVERLQLDRVLYLPTAQPPHKKGAAFAPALHRFAMAELALLDHDRLQVSDFELVERPSFTVETLDHFKTRFPEARLHLLVGSDSLANIESWRRWRDLFSLARIAVLRRPGWSRDRVSGAVSPALARSIAEGEVIWIKNRPLDISATEIRRRVRAGERLPRGWMPEAVLQYIQKYSLYQ
jgi:nicotinate-nucleotide adenylyltransferase